MERVALITDIDTPLGHSLLHHCYTDYDHIAGTVSSPVKDVSFPGVISERLFTIEWTRRSPFEVKNIILSVIKKYKKLDETLIIHSALADTTHFGNLEIADIDMAVDIWLKNYVFLCREILTYYTSVKGGVLILINNIYYENKKTISPLFELIHDGFRGFTLNLMASYREKAMRINSIESSSPDEKALSVFVSKCLRDRLRSISGKTITFHKK
jgi:hypothetical protein